MHMKKKTSIKSICRCIAGLMIRGSVSTSDGTNFWNRTWENRACGPGRVDGAIRDKPKTRPQQISWLSH